jgi:hypothetical protein
MSDDLEILLAKPRGFCAGVDRAIAIVERALALPGAPSGTWSSSGTKIAPCSFRLSTTNLL